MSKKYHTPMGTQDYLPVECFNKRFIEDKLRTTFSASGYLEVEGPGLEFFDLFADGEDPLKQEQLYLLPQPGQKLLTLRPDGTLPIARIASTYFQQDEIPLRLSYFTHIYRYTHLKPGEQRELPQAGIELIGVSGPEADAEVIATVIESFLALGITDFQIEMGQIDFFKQLLAESGLSAEQTNMIRDRIEDKNTIALEQYLNQLSMDPQLKQLFLKLPNLYGDFSVLSLARQLSPNPSCLQAINNLETIYTILDDYGLSQYLTFDLGLVHNLNYYTGMVFRVLSRQLGSSLCSGGRYDSLFTQFGSPQPATGAAIELKKVLLVLDKINQLQPLPTIDTLVCFNEGFRKEGYQLAKQLREQGQRVELFTQSPDNTNAATYATEKFIETVIIVDQPTGSEELGVSSDE